MLKDMTVGDVYRKYVLDYPRGKQPGMDDFADTISARIGAIEAFWILQQQEWKNSFIGWTSSLPPMPMKPNFSTIPKLRSYLR